MGHRSASVGVAVVGRGDAARRRDGHGRAHACVVLGVGVVAVAIGQAVSGGLQAAVQRHADVPVVSVPVAVRGRVHERVVVGARLDGTLDGRRQIVGVVEGRAAGVLGELAHRHVLADLRL